MTIIRANGARSNLEVENLRGELRRCYQDQEELIDIHVRLTRKRLRQLPVEEVEDEVLDLAKDFQRERLGRIRRKLGELFGGR
jgi:hypothetical protein